MLRLPLVPAGIALLVLAATCVHPASADDVTSEIVLDVPPATLQVGSATAVTGTVFGAERRSAKSPVVLALGDRRTGQWTWSAPVMTGVNGSFSLPYKVPAVPVDLQVVAPLMQDGSEVTLTATVSASQLTFPVTLSVSRSVDGETRVRASSPLCDEDAFELEQRVVERGSVADFTPVTRALSCSNGKLSGTFVTPPAGSYQYQLHRIVGDSSTFADSYSKVVSRPVPQPKG